MIEVRVTVVRQKVTVLVASRGVCELPTLRIVSGILSAVFFFKLALPFDHVFRFTEVTIFTLDSRLSSLTVSTE